MSSANKSSYMIPLCYPAPTCWTSATTNNKLNIHTGDARSYVVREEGLFELRAGNKTQQFDTLVGAFLAYYRLEEDASLWDITDGRVLIESKRVVVVDLKNF